MRVGEQALGVRAQDPERAEPEQRACRPLAAELECVAQGLSAFRDVAARGPEAPEGAREPKCQVSVADLASPVQRSAQVRVVVVQTGEGARLIAGARLDVELLRDGGVVVGVPLAAVLQPARPLEHLERVLADRLEHPETRLPVGIGPLAKEALLDERPEPVEHVDPEVAAQRLGGLQPGPAHEHAEPGKQRLLLGQQEVVAPLDRGAQRPLALVQILGAAGEEVQPLVEAAQERGRRK